MTNSNKAPGRMEEPNESHMLTRQYCVVQVFPARTNMHS